MAKPQIVQHIMSAPPVTCPPDEPLDRIAKLMLNNHCGFIPLTVDGTVVGVLSDRDIAMRCVPCSKLQALSTKHSPLGTGH